jgi:hypothetical protein
MIERAVLLHQDHHVLDILERARAPGCRHRQRFLDRRRHHRCRESGARGAKGKLQEVPPILGGHDCPVG